MLAARLGGNTSVDTECEGQIGLMNRLWGTERGGNSSLSERGVDRFKKNIEE